MESAVAGRGILVPAEAKICRVSWFWTVSWRRCAEVTYREALSLEYHFLGLFRVEFSTHFSEKSTRN